MVNIRPTCEVGISKLWPMSLSRPTGTNSVVLKMKAARARAITLSQLPLRVSEVLSMGRSVPEQGADGQVPRPSPRTTENAPDARVRGGDVRWMVVIGIGGNCRIPRFYAGTPCAARPPGAPATFPERWDGSGSIRQAIISPQGARPCSTKPASR